MMINLKRIFRHLCSTPWQLKRAFPQSVSETAHVGEMRFAVEAALSSSSLYHDQSARERAIDVFAQLRMWDTEHRNGVLIYLLLADHSVEIVVDRGMHAKTDASVWQEICRNMEAMFREDRYEQGVIDGIRAINHLLMQHFPSNGSNRNELPDKVVLL